MPVNIPESGLAAFVPAVKGFVDFSELFIRDMGIDLCCSDALVTEHFLD